MSKNKRKSHKQPHAKKMCDPGQCDECQYICEGDFLCEKYQEIVVSDWMPTDHYLMCRMEASDGQC